MNPNPHIDQAAGRRCLWRHQFTELASVTHSVAIDSASNQVNFVDINAGDLPTVSMAKDAVTGKDLVSFTYKDAHGRYLALNAQQLNDVKAVEVDLRVDQTAGNTNNGSATWTYTVADGNFDFLAAGETLTLTYTAKVDANYAPLPEITFKTFTITITGTNDVPVITTGPQTITLSGGTSTPGGPLTSTDATSGTLAFTDVDLTDTHTKVTTALTDAELSDGSTVPSGSLAALQAAITASVTTDSTGTGTGIVSWQLAPLPVDFIPAGQKLTLTYTVTVTDSQNAVSAPQTVTVTVVGIDHLVVTASAATTDEDGTSALTLALTNATALFENSDDSVTVTVSLDHGAKRCRPAPARWSDNGDGTFTLTAHMRPTRRICAA